MSERKIRVLVAKPGLDGHDRGAKIIARALRDAGMEVIYTGLRQTPEMIASAALQEDVDAVGISILSGAHNTLCPRIVNLLRENGMDDTLVLVGGIVPQEDIQTLKAIGVSEIFLPGTSTEDIVKFIRENVRSENWFISGIMIALPKIRLKGVYYNRTRFFNAQNKLSKEIFRNEKTIQFIFCGGFNVFGRFH